MCEDILFTCIYSDCDVSHLNEIHSMALLTSLTCPSITINIDEGQRQCWHSGSFLVQSVSSDLGFLSTYSRLLAKWTAVTMTTAQQTHDIFTVYRIWGIAVLLEWLIFSHGYPVLKSQLLGLCCWGCETMKLCKFCLFWAFSFSFATCIPSVCPNKENEKYAKKTINNKWGNYGSESI